MINRCINRRNKIKKKKHIICIRHPTKQQGKKGPLRDDSLVNTKSKGSAGFCLHRCAKHTVESCLRRVLVSFIYTAVL